MSAKKPMDPSVKAAWIGAFATIAVAIVAGVFALVRTSSPVSPTPTVPSTQPVLLSSPSPAQDPTPIILFSTASDAVQGFCSDIRSGLYFVAYDAVFSTYYRSQVSYASFYNGYNGYTCRALGTFSYNGSEQQITISFLNASTFRSYCQTFGVVNFTNEGWKIDQASSGFTCSL